jgi:hypothetical protein
MQDLEEVERTRFVPSQIGGIPPKQALSQFGPSEEYGRISIRDAVKDVQNMHLSYCTTSRAFALLSEKWSIVRQGNSEITK